MSDVIENGGAVAMRKLIPPIPTGKAEKDEPEVDQTRKSDVSTDIQSEPFFGLFFGMIKTNLLNIPRLLKNNWKWILPLVAVWFILSVIPTYKVPYSIRKIYLFIIFLTASYNNFVAKAIYAGFIYGTGIPLFKEFKKNGISPIIDKYKRTYGVIKQIFMRIGAKAMPIFVIGVGIGLFVSNFLTRNNKMDKYLVCFLTGFIFFKALSQGYGSIQARLFRAFFSDIFKLFRAKSPFNKEFIYVLFSGLSVGFIGSVVSYLAYSKLGDNAGYTIGGIIAFIGIILSFFVGGKNVQKEA